MPIFNKPKNYRPTTPRCCGTCLFKKVDDWGCADKPGNVYPEPYCIRDREKMAMGEPEEYYFRVCDYYRKA